MKKAAEVISYLSLVLLFLTPVMFYAGNITLEMNKLLLTAATVGWFVGSLCAMGCKCGGEK